MAVVMWDMWQEKERNTPLTLQRASPVKSRVERKYLHQPDSRCEEWGWRYGYGNMFYVELVNQYLTVPQVSGELAQKVMNEALKYQGWKYVYGGSNPNTSFDCSGLTQWCYGKAGISLPRTAQAQYDATQHLPLSQAKAGDLVFFHSTYNAGSYVHTSVFLFRRHRCTTQATR